MTEREEVSGWTESSNIELVMVNRNDMERFENKQNKRNGYDWLGANVFGWPGVNWSRVNFLPSSW